VAACAEVWGQPEGSSVNCEKGEICPSHTRIDILLLSLIVLFGISAVLVHQRTHDFMGDDVSYADLAKSLLQHGFYGIDGKPETTQPPGFAAILALLFAMSGYSYAICMGAVAVFEMLGFLATYELLRRRAPRWVSA